MEARAGAERLDAGSDFSSVQRRRQSGSFELQRNYTIDVKKAKDTVWRNSVEEAMG